MRKRIYRKKRLKDTSKRNLLIRADKRERFLAYSYIRGNFITFNNDKMHKKTKLSFDIRHCEVDNIMLKLLNQVNWFTIDKTNTDSNKAIYVNARDKVYMRILRKINRLSKKNGILYLYTPLTFFAFLTAPNTKFYYPKDSNMLYCDIHVKKEDAEDITLWFKKGQLEEITGLDKYYDINSCLRPGDCDSTATLRILEDDIVKMLSYIDRDKYVGKYLYTLCKYIQKNTTRSNNNIFCNTQLQEGIANGEKESISE